MSKFASDTVNSTKPYVPGEQPKDRAYVKLNTNENPYAPSEKAVEAVTKKVLEGLRKYPDPEAREATNALAKALMVNEKNVLLTGGSDEALVFSFLAYGWKGLLFPDVTYSFYKKIAAMFGLAYDEVPLKNDYTVDPKDYFGAGKTIVIANPNAPTGIALSDGDIIDILDNNPEDIVIVDQAYAAFSSVDAVPLIHDHKNLVVTETFSKCRSLAGARIGYIVADDALIEDLKKVKNSLNPYNLNSVSQILAYESAKDESSLIDSVDEIIRERGKLSTALKVLGFDVLPSEANFVFAKHAKISGENLYLKLKERGVLVRFFDEERTKDFVRITVGDKNDDDKLVSALKDILGVIS
ncbi:MAG: histidinol-phosphate transaminase [Clostridia bacterium]|nr:histidinol-phosphate transaminase [Clostridia bacterium]